MAIDKAIDYTDMDVATDGEVVDRFKNYKKGKHVNVPSTFQARANSTPVRLAYITYEEAGILSALKPGVPHDGPMHIPNYNDYDPDRGYTSGAAMSAAEAGKHTSDTLASNLSNEDIQNIRSGAIAAGAGQVVNPSFFGPKNRVSKDELRRARAFAPNAYRATRGSPFGLGNILGGIAGLMMGIPGFGLITGGLSSLKDHKTLKDWWGSRDQWNQTTKGPVDYSDMSKYNQLGLYTDRIVENPNYLDFDNTLAINTKPTILPEKKPLVTDTTEKDVLDTYNDFVDEDDVYQGGTYS